MNKNIQDMLLCDMALHAYMQFNLSGDHMTLLVQGQSNLALHAYI